MKLRIKLEDYVYIRMKSEKKSGIGRNHIPLLCAPCLQTRLDGHDHDDELMMMGQN